jgi:hypothetical protein
MSDDGDSGFHTLAAALRKRIDAAFNEFPTTSATDAPPAGGGFIPQSDPDDVRNAGIPLSVIPSALKKLGLPTDAQVLGVFEGAAKGQWKEGDDQAGRDREEKVELDDWREVCAILVGQQEEAYHEDDGEGDEYREEGDDDEEDAAEDSDYDDSNESPSSHKPRRMTKNQNEVALQTFALFFPPSVPPDQLASKRIRIEDIQRVAGLLGEKLKAVEITEMLEAFSSQKDLSVGLEDFKKVMQVAGLV